MKLIPRNINYYKRRLPDQPLVVKEATIKNLSLIDYSSCDIEITLDGKQFHPVTGRVTKNDQSGKWSVSCQIPGDHRLIVLDVVE